MSAQVINLADRTAYRAAERQVDEALFDIRTITKRMEKDAQRRRERIEALLQGIERDVAWRCPSDTEVPFA